MIKSKDGRQENAISLTCNYTITIFRLCTHVIYEYGMLFTSEVPKYH